MFFSNASIWAGEKLSACVITVMQQRNETTQSCIRTLILWRCVLWRGGKSDIKKLYQIIGEMLWLGRLMFRPCTYMWFFISLSVSRPSLLASRFSNVFVNAGMFRFVGFPMYSFSVRKLSLFVSRRLKIVVGLGLSITSESLAVFRCSCTEANRFSKYP